MPPSDGDKEDRGRLLIIAATKDVPGAAILAGTAALRAGVGKVSIAAAAEVATLIAQAIVEARVVPVVHARGRLEVPATRRHNFDAVLIGPGMSRSTALSRLVASEIAARPQSVFILDAGAIDALREPALRRRLARSETPQCIVTPHAGEMASLIGQEKRAVEAHALHLATQFAAANNVVLALKGASTFIAEPQGRRWRHRSANLALAASGSGDVLAGIVAGLAARGATPSQAAVWGVALHARAGDRLAARYGPLGALARELAQEIPSIMHDFSARPIRS